MPELCRFHGLIITMYHNEHGVAHFHVRFGGGKATVEVESERVRGALPPSSARLLLEWAHLHRAELLENWRLARLGAPLNRIDPLE